MYLRKGGSCEVPPNVGDVMMRKQRRKCTLASTTRRHNASGEE